LAHDTAMMSRLTRAGTLNASWGKPAAASGVDGVPPAAAAAASWPSAGSSSQSSSPSSPAPAAAAGLSAALVRLCPVPPADVSQKGIVDLPVQQGKGQQVTQGTTPEVRTHQEGSKACTLQHPTGQVQSSGQNVADSCTILVGIRAGRQQHQRSTHCRGDPWTAPTSDQECQAAVCRQQ
jgi:hypothetical protein